jgi:putative membrane protein
LYEATLRSDWLHNVAHVHYVASGFLLFAVILALDPLPHRMDFVLRIMMIIGLGPMHVLLGVPIMSGNEVFALDYYTELGRTWGPTLLQDQQTGGGLLWVFGDVVTVGFLAGLYLQWLRSDARDARRIDRQLDRIHGDAATIPVPWAVLQAEVPGAAPSTAGADSVPAQQRRQTP